MAFRFETANERWAWFKRAADEYDTMGFYDPDEIGNSLDDIYNQNAYGTLATFARIHNAILDIGSAGDEMSRTPDQEFLQRFNDFNAVVRDNFAFIVQELENWDPQPEDSPFPDEDVEHIKDLFVSDAQTYYQLFEAIVQYYEADPEQLTSTSEQLSQAHNGAMQFAEMLDKYYEWFVGRGGGAAGAAAV